MNYDQERPSSRVTKPPGGGSSNIFGEPEPIKPKANESRSNPSFRSTVFSNAEVNESTVAKRKPVRRDPITGEVIEDRKKDVDVNADDAEDPEEEKENSKQNVEKEKSKIQEPISTPVPAAGVRYVQPPGGRSSFTLG